MERAIPYRGDAPYIFISYAHRDSENVLPIITTMQNSGFRIWFDEGIDPGTEWDNVIAAQIEKCNYFLAFVSQNYLASENCKDELNFARDLGKHRLLVYLEDVALPSGMAMRMNRIQSVFKYKYADEKGFYDMLYSADGIYEMCDGEPRRAARASTTPPPYPSEASFSSGTATVFPPPHAKVSEPFEMVKAFQKGFAHTKHFFEKPSKAQLFRRFFAVCIYAALFFGGSGALTAFAILALAALPLGIAALVATFKEKKANPTLYAALAGEKAARNGNLVIASRILLVIALPNVVRMPIAFLYFLFWTVYCFFASFVPKEYKKLSLGLFSIGRLTFRILCIVLALILIGMSV